MSLIYTALSKLEQGPQAPGTPAQPVARPRPVAPDKPAVPRWVLWIAGCALAAVLAGWLAMNLLRERISALQPGPEAQPAVAAPAPAAAIAPPLPAAPSPISAAPPAAASAQPEQHAPAMLPMAPPVAIQPANPAAEVRPAAVAPTPQAAAGPAVRPAVKVAAARRAKPSPPAPTADGAAPEISEDEVARQAGALTQAIRQAVQSGKHDEAEAMLARLGKLLPAESITLLRLRAWHKMQSGDSAQATTLYRQIVERIPDDEPAALNLALLYWKSGRQNEARALLGVLAERNPESRTVQDYVRQFGALR